MPRTLAQNAQYIANTIKPAIKSAIEAQGVTVPATDSFLDYADRIGEIEGGGSGYQLKDLPTGSISTVTDAAELPLNALKVSVEAWQEGSGDPSPSNIRPIHGWDSGQVVDIGKNRGAFWQNKYMDSSGNMVSSNANGMTKIIKCHVGEKYTINFDQPPASAGFAVYLNPDLTNLTQLYRSMLSFPYTFEISGSTTATLYMVVWAYFSDVSQVTQATFDTRKFQLELGNQATTYEPYQGKQYTLDFPQTIYGAEWDVVNGNATEEYGFVEYDGSADENWGVQNFTANSAAYIDVSGKKIGFQTSICNLATNINGSWGDSQHLAYYSDHPSLTRVYFNRPTDTMPLFFTMQEWRDFLANNPIQLKYELATPTTIPLSPLSIRMLQGVNNLYADCGDIIDGEYFIGSSGAYDLYDYIQSDGTQYINTGRKINAGDTFYILYSVLASSGQTWSTIWGAYDGNNTTRLVLVSSDQKDRYDGGTFIDRTSYDTSSIYSDSLTVNNALNGDVYVFSGTNDITWGTASIRLYQFSINGDDYLPCKRRSDGVFGLYDVANSQFLTDSASGNAFVGGNNLGVRIG